MNNEPSLNSSLKNKSRPVQPKVKTLIFVLEIALVVTLLVVWASSKSLQQSKSLWVLFFYSFPAEFLIAIVPHEPILLYFGKFYSRSLGWYSTDRNAQLFCLQIRDGYENFPKNPAEEVS